MTAALVLAGTANRARAADPVGEGAWITCGTCKQSFREAQFCPHPHTCAGGGQNSAGQQAAEAAQKAAAAKELHDRELETAARRKLADEDQRNRDSVERQRAAEEEKQQRFLNERNAAAGTLKKTGTPTFSGGLKGSNGGSSGLKDASGDTGIKKLSPGADGVKTRAPDAWKQLYCASSMAKYGLAAAERGDTVEAQSLMHEAVSALNGGATTVECPASVPDPPRTFGNGPDMKALAAFYEKLAPEVVQQAERVHARKERKADVEAAAARVEQLEKSAPAKGAARPPAKSAAAVTTAAPSDPIAKAREDQRKINEERAHEYDDVIAKQKAFQDEMEKAIAAKRQAQAIFNAESSKKVDLERLQSALEKAQTNPTAASAMLNESEKYR